MSHSRQKVLKEAESADGLSLGKMMQNVWTVGAEQYGEVHCRKHHG